MNFKEYVELQRSKVFSTILAYMPIKEPAEHYRIVRDYSERQGSYRRPGLLMLSGQMFGASADDLLLPGAAMQLSEDWILIHDDVEDNSEMRRGKAALHKLYGNEIAINAGDAAHMMMWQILKDYILRAGLQKGNAIYNKFYEMLECTVEGQYLDTNFIYNIRNLRKASEALYYSIIESKTCYYTVYGPMQLGAMVAGQGSAMMDTIREIGSPAGRAFQIVDDILDMTADEKSFGKKRFGDLYEGKITLIMLHAYKNSTDAEKERIDSIFVKSRSQKSEEDINFLREMVEKYRSLDYARETAERYGHIARQTIDRNRSKLPNNEYTEVMLSAVEELYLRKK